MTTPERRERDRQRQRERRARLRQAREAETLRSALRLALSAPGGAVSGPLAEALADLRAALLPPEATEQARQLVELALRAKIAGDGLGAWLSTQPVEARLDPKVLAIEAEARHLRQELALHLKALRSLPPAKPASRAAWWEQPEEPESGSGDEIAPAHEPEPPVSL